MNAATKWSKALLALMVTIPIGLAPFLGKVGVPGFSALLSLFPESLQNSALTIATMAMGLVAVSVQFFSEEGISAARMRRWFVTLLILLFLFLISIAYFHNQYVVTIYTGNDARPVSYLVSSTRTPHCPCSVEDSDASCIENIGLQPSRIPLCWADRDIRNSSFILLLNYVFLMAGTGGLIGLLVLRGRRRK